MPRAAPAECDSVLMLVVGDEPMNCSPPGSTLVLLLTRMDRFATRLRERRNFARCFSDYTGDETDAEACARHLALSLIGSAQPATLPPATLVLCCNSLSQHQVRSHRTPCKCVALFACATLPSAHCRRIWPCPPRFRGTALSVAPDPFLAKCSHSRTHRLW